jgi:hypothetical protein
MHTVLALPEATAASLTAEIKTLLSGVERIPSAKLQFFVYQDPRESSISHLILGGIEQNFPIGANQTTPTF